MIRIAVFFCCVCVCLSACTPAPPYRKDSGSIYGKDYTIWYQSPVSLFPEIEAEMEHSNISLNAYNPHSIISRVNNNEPVELNDCFIQVFNKSVEIAAMTNGIFDATCFPLVAFWRNAFTDPDQITEYQLDSIRQFVGYRKVRIENGKVVKDDPRIQITLTALAKGFTCDRIKALLEARGIQNYLIDLGGVTTAKGVDEQGNHWQSAIRKPVETDDNRTIGIQEIIRMQDRLAVATSGDFKNFYIRNGKKYAHTINPLTGYPAEQDVLSSTIMATDGITADALSTAFTALGSEEIRKLGDSLAGIDYFIIYTDEAGGYKITFSEGMKQYFVRRPE